MSETRSGEPGAPQPRETDQAAEPVLPEVSGDDRDEGWGENPQDGRRDEQWYRRERPPHHGD